MRRAYPALLCVGMALLFLGLAVGALNHSLGAVLFCSIALYVVDYLLRRTENERLLGGLGRIGAGGSWRFFYRDVLILISCCAQRTEPPHAGRTGRDDRCAPRGTRPLLGLRLYVNYRRNRQFESRNLGVPGEQLPAPPSDTLIVRGTDLVLHTDMS